MPHKTLEARLEYIKKSLHQQFSRLHHRGEWFNLTPELMEFIGEIE